jgi:hypothetical protein
VAAPDPNRSIHPVFQTSVHANIAVIPGISLICLSRRK